MRAGPFAAALLLPIRGYRRWVSPVLPARCRFVPTCSAYAEQALHLHGARRGGWLTLRRVGRCHPFSAGGVDPVPPFPVSTTSRAGRPTSTLRAVPRDPGALL
ncbi:MAG TPA: membrane protein insertion efficiency factor YidD [Mycobacteriales bacterium]|nr:membrane protein insertion efficiency factor YidD [Mycobacteriales bacterium]